MDPSASSQPHPDELFGLLYAELREIAQRQMGRERPAHTLQATALVHEAWLRLERAGVDPARVERAYFFFAAARAMREILIDHARARSRQKRGGGRKRIRLTRLDLAAAEDPDDLLAIDEAIARLEEVDARASEIVRLRFFAGLEAAQVAELLGCSLRTVMRDWAWARAWLYDQLQEGGT